MFASVPFGGIAFASLLTPDVGGPGPGGGAVSLSADLSISIRMGL